MKISSSKDFWSKDFILLLLINFINSAGMQLFNSAMSKYAISLGCPDSLLGIVVSAYAIMVFAASIVSGVISDRSNKKYLLNIAIGGQALAVLGYAFIGSSMPVLIMLRMLHGFCSGLSMVVNMAMVAFTVPKAKLGVGMGVYGLGQTVSMAIGPSIGLFLISSIGFRYMFLVAFAFNTIATALTFFVFSYPAVRKEKSKFSIKDMLEPGAVPMAIIGLLNSTAFSSITAYLVVLADKRNISNIGLYFTVYAVVLFATRPLIGKTSDKFPIKYIIYPTSAMTVCSLFLIAFASHLWMLLLAAVLMGAGNGGANPVIQAESVRYVSPGKRGAASSTFMMGMSSGFAIGPMIAGYLAVSIGYGSMFAAMTIFAFGSILVIAVTEKRRKKLSAAARPEVDLE